MERALPSDKLTFSKNKSLLMKSKSNERLTVEDGRSRRTTDSKNLSKLTNTVKKLQPIDPFICEKINIVPRTLEKTTTVDDFILGVANKGKLRNKQNLEHRLY